MHRGDASRFVKLSRSLNREVGPRFHDLLAWLLKESRRDEAADDSARVGIGSLPALSIVCSIGLLLVSHAFSAGRTGETWAEPLFWVGVLVVYVPIVYRLASDRVPRGERIGLVVTLGVALYVVKLLHSPLMFTFHDEFYHWRTAIDILRTGQLFSENPLLPVSPLYPGLESVTAAVVSLTGLSLFSSGAIVVGLARLVLVIGLFHTFEYVTGSSRSAGLATALYAANPTFLFFGSMFKYESLALGFAALGLMVMVWRQRTSQHQSRALAGVAVVIIAALLITHHVTAYMFTTFLVLWTVTSWFRRRWSENHPVPNWLTALAVLGNLAWLLLVAEIVIGYLAPHLSGAIAEILRITAREEEAGRQLFQTSSSGVVVPLWERVIGVTSVLLIMLGLSFGLWQIWRRYRTSATAIALGIATLMYPAGLALRFTNTGWEIGNRTSEFVFVGVGFVVALGVVCAWLVPRTDRFRIVLIALCAGVIFAGGVIAGWPSSWRLPGPYDVSSGSPSSITEQGVSGAEWSREYLGPHRRVAADKTNHLLMGSIGEQSVQTSLSGGLDPQWVLFAPEVSESQIRSLERAGVEYLIVDNRLRQSPRLSRRYYPDADIDDALSKFDEVEGISRIFDSGDLVIYDVRALIDDS